MLVGGLLLADLGARNFAEDRIESRLASSSEGERGLEVEIGGTFFVPQVFSGEFESLGVSAVAVRREGVALKKLDIEFRSLEVSLSNLMDGKGAVTVAGGRGSAVVPAASLEAGLRSRGIDAEVGAGDGLTVTVAGVAARVEDVSLDGNTLTLTAEGVEPLAVELPPPPPGVDYADARIENGRLVLELDVPEGSLEI